MKGLIFIRYIGFSYLFLCISGCTRPSFESLVPQSNFSLNKFLGIWFEIKWLPGEPHNESDIWRNFYQSFQLNNSSTQNLRVPGQARILNNDTCFSIGPWSILTNNTAQMILEKKDMSSNISLNWPYYVMKTDYDNYALIYACTTANYSYTDPCEDRVLWLFSRTTSLSNVDLDNFIQTELCVNLTDLEMTPQDGKQCYYSSSNILVFSPPPHIIIFIFLFLPIYIK